MYNYGDMFAKLESVMKEHASKFNEFEAFKEVQNQAFSNAECFDILTAIVFYSGFRAETVSRKMHIIKKHFPDYATVAQYDDRKTRDIIADPDMIKNERKIKSCINNAKTFSNIVNRFGSFEQYMDMFKPSASFENLMLLKEELEYKFEYLGGITTYHFLTDVGLPVLKPDRVITRIFERIGLIENEKQLLKTIIQGRKFAEATNLPIRYIDIILVKYGQMGSDDAFGLKDGICLEKKPKCNLCKLGGLCRFPTTSTPPS